MKKNAHFIIVSILILIVLILLVFTLTTKEPSIDTKNNKNNELIASNTLISVTKTEKSDSVVYEVIDRQRDLFYSWEFEKNENFIKSLKSNMEIDVNLKLTLLDSINSSLDEMVTNDDKLIVNFEHHGSLPSKATIKLNVKDKYKDGDKLYLYYYNEEKGEIDFIANNIIVKNGVIEFSIDHCSNYLLTASIVQDAVGNPKNINLIIIVMAGVIIVLIGVTLFQNKK